MTVYNEILAHYDNNQNSQTIIIIQLRQWVILKE